MFLYRHNLVTNVIDAKRLAPNETANTKTAPKSTLLDVIEVSLAFGILSL